MPRRLRVRPTLELLEDRAVPATVRFVSGTLLISNPSLTGTSTSLTVVQDPTTANKFTVKDGAMPNGTYSGVGNINITGSNFRDLVTVDLNGKTYTGNLLVNTGNGDDTIAVTGGAAAGAGIAGNVTLLPGLGNDSVSLNTVAGKALTIGGNVNVTDTSGLNTFQLGNAGAVTNVGGDVTITGFADRGATPAVQIGGGKFDTIGGRLSVQSVNTSNNVTVDLGKIVVPSGPAGFAQGVQIGRGLTVQTGAGNDTVTIVGALASDNAAGGVKTPGVGTIINGDTYINLGEGNNYFDTLGTRTPLAQIGGQETTFNGNVTYVAGSGSDSIELAGFGRGTGVGTEVNGNLTVNLGDGNNNFGDMALGGGNNGGLDFVETSVSGNLSLTAGNGNNVMDFFGVRVGGSEAFHFGNGNNGTAAVPLLIRRPGGGTMTFTTGNGNNYLQIATPNINEAPVLFNLNVRFGNGDDTFQVGGAAGDRGGSITGSVDGGGRLTANVFLFDPTLWTVVSPFTLSNFP
jgi:hypothetical protein